MRSVVTEPPSDSVPPTTSTKFFLSVKDTPPASSSVPAPSLTRDWAPYAALLPVGETVPASVNVFPVPTLTVNVLSIETAFPSVNAPVGTDAPTFLAESVGLAPLLDLKRSVSPPKVPATSTMSSALSVNAPPPPRSPVTSGPFPEMPSAPGWTVTEISVPPPTGGSEGDHASALAVTCPPAGTAAT